MDQTRKRRASFDEEPSCDGISKCPRQGTVALAGWKVVDPAKESFQLPADEALKKHPSFIWRSATLLEIFLRFVDIPLVQQIARNCSEDSLQYSSGDMISLSLSKIYKGLAFAIRIYGEQVVSTGVKKIQRPLRQQLKEHMTYFEANFPETSSVGISFLECFVAKFLFDAQVTNLVSENFRSVLRGIGNTIAGDEKLLKFCGKCCYNSYILLFYLVATHECISRLES